MRVDRFHHITDVSSGLVNDPGVFEPGTLNEREKVVVERHQNPVLLDRVREVFPVGVAQSSFVTSCVDGPATTAESIATGTQILSSRYSGLMSRQIRRIGYRRCCLIVREGAMDVTE